MNELNSLWNSFLSILPALFRGIVLILVAWAVAALLRVAIRKGLAAINFDERLAGWGAVNSAEQGRSMIDTIAQVFFYLVWVLFLPGIFETLGLTSVATPIQNMIDTALAYLPNLIGAILLVIIGHIVAKFVKNLVYNLALSLNVDGWMSKINETTGNTSRTQTISEDQKDTLANVLGNIVYVLIIIPILVVALETLGIRSISVPIINVLDAILAAIPNILVAVILLAIGIAIAKFVGDLVANLLRGTGLNNLTRNMQGTENLDLAKITGQIVAVLIGLFFFVEALNVLNLAVLNTIGAAIIAYLPNLLFAIIIFGVGVVGGQWLAGLISQSTGSKWAGRLAQYIVLAFALFMVLDQLNFANDIVNAAFIFIIGGLSVAFALAFGLGGRDFAKRQLEKFDDRLEEEKQKTGESSAVDEDPANQPPFNTESMNNNKSDSVNIKDDPNIKIDDDSTDDASKDQTRIRFD